MKRMMRKWMKMWSRSRAVENVVGVDVALQGECVWEGRDCREGRGDGMWWRDIDVSVPGQEWCLDWIQKKRCGGRWTRQGLSEYEGEAKEGKKEGRRENGRMFGSVSVSVAKMSNGQQRKKTP